MNSKKKITKTALVAGMLASSLIPHAVSAADIEIKTAAQLTAAINEVALTGDQAYIDAVAKLTTAFKGIGIIQQKQLTNATKIKLTNHENAAKVVKLIIELPAEVAIKEADEAELKGYKANIATIRADYAKLSTTARNYVKNYSTVTATEALVTSSLLAAQNAEALKPWTEALNALPTKKLNLSKITAEDFAKLDDSGKYAASELENITNARKAYTALSASLKKVVSATDLKTLTNHEAQAKYQATLTTAVNASKLTAFTKEVDGIVPTGDADYAKAVNTVTDKLATDGEYKDIANSLSASLKIKIANHEAASAVAKDIAAVKDMDVSDKDADEIATLKADAAKIRAAYTALTTTARTYVKNLADLTAHETAVTAREAFVKNEAALTDWTDAFEALQEIEITSDFTTMSLEEFEALDDAYKYTLIDVDSPEDDTHEKTINTARAEYNKLTATLKAVVSEQYEKLVSVEKNIAAQKTLAASVEDAALADKVADFVEKLTALDPAGTDYVTKVTELKETEKIDEILAELTTAQKINYNNHVAAAEVVEIITTAKTNLEALNETAVVSDYEAIETELTKATTKYKALSSTTRTFVTKYADVAKMQAEITAKKAALENATGLQPWTGAYNNIKDLNVIDFVATTKEELDAEDAVKFSGQEKDAIKAARDAYDALAPELQKAVLADEYNKLLALEVPLNLQLALEAKIADEAGAEKFEEFLKQLTDLDSSSTTYVTEVEAFTAVYKDEANKDFVAKLTTAQKLNYNNHVAAAAVVKENQVIIDEVKAFTEDTTLAEVTATEGKIATAKENFSKLSTTARARVNNLADFNAAVAKVAEKKTELTKADAIKTWTEALKHTDMPTTYTDLSAETYKKFVNADGTGLADLVYSEDNIKAVESARAIYATYSTTVRSYIDKNEYANFVKIETAIKRQAELIAIAEQLVGADKWEATLELVVTDLGDTAAEDLEKLTAETYEEYATKYENLLTNKANIEKLRELYDALPLTVKSVLVKADVKALTDAEALVAKLEALEPSEEVEGETAETVTEEIAKIAELDTDQLQKLYDKYDELSDEEKAKITTANRLKLENYYSASLVSVAIKTLVEATTLENIAALEDEEGATTLEKLKGDLSNIRTAYLKLSTSTRGLVIDYALVADYEAAVTAQEKKIANAELLISWTAAYTELEKIKVLDLSGLTAETYATADKYEDDDKTVITTARDEYNKLSASVKTSVTKAELDHLLALEAGLKTQANVAVLYNTKLANDFVKTVDALSGSAPESYAADVNDVRDAYDALADDVKAKVSSAVTLKLKNHEAAVDVIAKIAALDDIQVKTEEDIPAYKEAVAGARTAYSKLSSSARSYVNNLTNLIEHEAVVKLL